MATPKAEPAPAPRPLTSAEQLRARALAARERNRAAEAAAPAQGPAMSPSQAARHREQRSQEQDRAFRERYEAKRPVQTPHGYTVEEHYGIKTYVSPQGNRYTEYDVKRGALDKPAKPEDFPAARVVSLPAPQRRGIVSRIKSAFGR